MIARLSCIRFLALCPLHFSNLSSQLFVGSSHVPDDIRQDQMAEEAAAITHEAATQWDRPPLRSDNKGTQTGSQPTRDLYGSSSDMQPASVTIRQRPRVPTRNAHTSYDPPKSDAFIEKELAQAALAAQYGSAVESNPKDLNDPNRDRKMQAVGSKARELGLDLPQAGVGPTDENIRHAMEVKERARKAVEEGEGGVEVDPDTPGSSPRSGLGAGTVEAPESKEVEV